MELQRLNLFHAAVAWEIGFAVAMGIIPGIIIVWQRARGSSLAELGWGRHTTTMALVLAILLGVAYHGGLNGWGESPYLQSKSHSAMSYTANPSDRSKG
jgi:hypothetical protein